MNKNIVAIALLIFSLAGCESATTSKNTKVIESKSDTNTDTDEVWKEFNEENYHASIPEEWVVERNKGGSKFILYAPKTSKQDTFKERIDLKIETLPENTPTIENFMKYKINRLKGRLQNQSEISSKIVNHDGRDFLILTYSGMGSGYDLKFEKQIWVERGKAYVLTFTSEKKQFDNYIDVAHKIMADITE